MKLPQLAHSKSLKGKRILLRVDWNIPRSGQFASEDSLKVSRSIETIKDFSQRGAIVLVATHWGRPKGRDVKFSTRRLQRIVEATYHVPMKFLGERLDVMKECAKACEIVKKAEPGTIFVLENVRFYAGEEKNDRKLAKTFASLADLFVNDAFATCHRAHASVVGITSFLPSFAGPNVLEEVKALEKLLKVPKHPYIAVIGGSKISTKIGVIKALLATADRVCVGGAMAHAFFVAQKKQIGNSFVEKEGIPLAKKLLSSKKLVLPTDALVASSIDAKSMPYAKSTNAILKKEMIGDIGPETMREWSRLMKTAKTIVWNGPVGVTEFPQFSHGSTVLARVIASRSKGKAYGVVGGGDTLPIAIASGMSEWIDHLSTGGGAMLEFISLKGKLPGLLALEKSGK